MIYFDKDSALIGRIANARELLWLNPNLAPAIQAIPCLPVTQAEVMDAEARLERFRPFIMRRFPETARSGGLIESPLTGIPGMLHALQTEFNAPVAGQMLLKRDCDLPISGSIKARGGIYEVLKHAEALALSEGILKAGDSYDALASDKARKFFSKYSMQVGSTGNLGLSIGVMSAALGFKATVHMSADARQWKKDLLRGKGVTVIEYAGDYSLAVREGRARSDADPASYFVDDENSRDLFLGYAVAAYRLKAQLDEAGLFVDKEHPLFVYLPCGVGGGPGGVAFGLKLIFGDDAHIFFVEPTQAPCMLVGMATGLHENICVGDVGLTGKTLADGLAVGRPSGFVSRIMEPLLSGEATVSDERLPEYLKALYRTDGIFAEPSACAAFEGARALFSTDEGSEYILRQGLSPYMKSALHIPWATGGGLVPDAERARLLK